MPAVESSLLSEDEVTLNIPVVVTPEEEPAAKVDDTADATFDADKIRAESEAFPLVEATPETHDVQLGSNTAVVTDENLETEEDRWIDRNAIITKIDHQRNEEYAREVVEDLVSSAVVDVPNVEEKAVPSQLQDQSGVASSAPAVAEIATTDADLVVPSPSSPSSSIQTASNVFSASPEKQPLTPPKKEDSPATPSFSSSSKESPLPSVKEGIVSHHPLNLTREIIDR